MADIDPNEPCIGHRRDGDGQLIIHPVGLMAIAPLGVSFETSDLCVGQVSHLWLPVG